jgi:hypothetical protein
VAPTAVVDAVEKKNPYPPLELNPCHPVCRPLLCRLSYPNSTTDSEQLWYGAELIESSDSVIFLVCLKTLSVTKLTQHRQRVLMNCKGCGRKESGYYLGICLGGGCLITRSRRFLQHSVSS